MNKIYLKHLLIAVFTGITTLLSGQNKNPQKHNEQVVIVGSTDPIINNSRKLSLTPEKPVQLPVKTDFEFVPINKYFYTPSKFKPIKPASIRSYIIDDIYNNVIRAGFGTRISPYAEFFHSQSHKGKYKFDFHALHHSTFGKIKGYSNAGNSISLAEAGFTKYLRRHTIEFNTGYEYRTNRNYYDTPLAETINDDSLKIAYNLFFFDGILSSNYKNNKRLHHTVKLGGYYFFNKVQQDYYTKSNELNIYTKFDFHKSYRVTNILDYQYLGISGKAEFFKNNGIIDYTNGNSIGTPVINTFITTTPYFKARYGILAFNAGINISYLYAQKKSHFMIFPDLYAKVNLLPEYLQLYTGAKGGYTKNSYKLLSSENPFISPLTPDSWKKDKITVFGGFKGNIAKKLGFNIQINWSLFNDDYFFISTYENKINLQKNKNIFLIQNDKGSLFNFNTQLTYNISKKINIYASFQHNSYNLDSLTVASGKLLTELRIGGSYLIKNKFKPWTEIIYVGKRYSTVMSSTISPPIIVDIDGFVDINIGLEYIHNENFSGFIKATNLLNNKYEYFYKHPTYGIEVMFGVGYKF